MIPHLNALAVRYAPVSKFSLIDLLEDLIGGDLNGYSDAVLHYLDLMTIVPAREGIAGWQPHRLYDIRGFRVTRRPDDTVQMDIDAKWLCGRTVAPVVMRVIITSHKGDLSYGVERIFGKDASKDLMTLLVLATSQFDGDNLEDVK